MYQRADFSGARQFIGEQLKRAKELALLLLCEFRQGTVSVCANLLPSVVEK
jgi:hypothetical protein